MYCFSCTRTAHAHPCASCGSYDVRDGSPPSNHPSLVGAAAADDETLDLTAPDPEPTLQIAHVPRPRCQADSTDEADDDEADDLYFIWEDIDRLAFGSGKGDPGLRFLIASPQPSQGLLPPYMVCNAPASAMTQWVTFTGLDHDAVRRGLSFTWDDATWFVIPVADSPVLT